MSFVSHEEKLRTLGARYGYPGCCIDAFVEKMKDFDGRPKRIQKKVCNNSGFIPCTYCSWKILSKQCSLEDLITNRQVEEPFRSKKK
jgi:hypothetical protein